MKTRKTLDITTSLTVKCIPSQQLFGRSLILNMLLGLLDPSELGQLIPKIPGETVREKEGKSRPIRWKKEYRQLCSA